MNCYEIQDQGYTGQVWPATRHLQQFYVYSVSRTPQREQLFDGVAGDLAEAVSTMHAHIRFLASDGGIFDEGVTGRFYENNRGRAGEAHEYNGYSAADCLRRGRSRFL
jgi:hypothetical protein